MKFTSTRLLAVACLAFVFCVAAGAQTLTINGMVDDTNPADGAEVVLTLSLTGTGDATFNGFEAAIMKVGGGPLSPASFDGPNSFFETGDVSGIPRSNLADVRLFTSGDNLIVSLATNSPVTVTDTALTFEVHLVMANGWEPFGINLGNLLFGVGGNNEAIVKTITGFPINFGGTTPTDTPTNTPVPTTVTPSPTTPTPTPTTPPVTTPTPTIPTEPAFFVLDDYGAVHTGGAANAVPLTGGPYFGFQIARAMELIFGTPPTTNGVGAALLDGFGAVHTYSSTRPDQFFYFFPDLGDIASDLALFQAGPNSDIGMWVLDRTGTVWPVGTAVGIMGSGPTEVVSPALNGNTQRAVDITLSDNTGDAGWILDNMGNVTPFGGATNPNFPTSMQNDWVDLEIVQGQAVRMDSSGVLTWQTSPISGFDLPMIDGGLAVDLEVQAGGLVALDRYGAIYTSGAAVKPSQGQGPPFFGFEAAVDLEIAPPAGINVNNPTVQ